MSTIDKWEHVLAFSSEINDLNRNVLNIMMRVSDIIQQSEFLFGIDSNEMDHVFESLLDLRYSKIADLLNFIDMFSERQTISAFSSLQ